MRYFLDTEFIEDGRTIDLISIGIVAEDEREYYAINYNCDFKKASNWVKKNVLVHIPQEPLPQVYGSRKKFEESPEYKQGWRVKEHIAQDIKEFFRWSPKKPHFSQEDKPEIWGYYSASDWVAFYQLFGTMMDLPKGFPMYCRDIKQLCDQLGNPELPFKCAEHHALYDARWNKKAWEFLKQLETRVKL